MDILASDQQKAAEQYLQKAAEVAKQSTCRRARCGTVIVKAGKVVAEGYNSPPQNKEENRKCEIKSELLDNFKSDDTGCVHAEQRAIIQALQNGIDLTGSRLYFVRLDGSGDIKLAGEPYCTICSKLALDTDVAEFVLWHDKGITVYDTKEYNDLSFQYGK